MIFPGAKIAKSPNKKPNQKKVKEDLISGGKSLIFFKNYRSFRYKIGYSGNGFKFPAETGEPLGSATDQRNGNRKDKTEKKSKNRNEKG